MIIDDFNKKLLETVGVGLVIASYPDLSVIFRNHHVAEWFPGLSDPTGRIADSLPGLDGDRMLSALDAGEIYTDNVETKVGRRAVSLNVSATRTGHGDASWIIIELQNVTKMKELEYMISSYSQMVERQNRSLEKEKERAEKLLLNIMPESVYRELKTFGVTTPQRYDDASILMLDFVGFTQMSVTHDPVSLITELNDIFTAFDRIAEQQGCERIKTIGDAYVAVSGLPDPSPDHAYSIARVALMFVRYLKRRNQTHHPQWHCRVGIAPGPVIGSVVGIQKYVYDIFGPGINLASRLEALCNPMEIILSEGMYPLLRDAFQMEPMGEAEIRGFGSQQIYRLVGDGELSADFEPSA